ncbi:MAG: serine hydrolase domain-containing protein, partial [Pseudomonadota bacterium]
MIAKSNPRRTTNRKSIGALAALSALGLGACLGAPQPNAAPAPEIGAPIEQVMAPWRSERAPGVVVAISLNDEIVYADGAGMANLEHNLALAPDSVLQVASVSKQFTAFATLLLVAEGAIDLDADIRTYLPDLNATETVITVRHLLDHAGGLREQSTLAGMAGWRPDDVHTRAQIQALVRRQRGVNFAAGAEMEYSNTGYGLLAEIVAHASGQTFEAFMQARIFDPLEMQDTRFPTSRNTLIPKRAASYYPDGDGFNNVIVASEGTGSTGLYTSALDLLKWAENFETQTIGDPVVFDLMAERFSAENGAESTFAKGQEFRVYKGFDTWSHGGTDAGYRSFLLRVPSEDLEIAVISNRTDFDKATFAFSLADLYLPLDPEDAARAPEEPPEEPPEDPPVATAEMRAALAGDYELFPGVIFAIRAEPEGLTFAMLGASREDLEPLPQIAEREFLLNAQPERTLIFAAPERGQSPKLSYRLGLDGTIEAPRVTLAPFDAASVDLSLYVGRCHSEELDTHYELSQVDGVLGAKQARNPWFPMTPYQPDTFAGQGALQKLVFQRDEAGLIQGFYASAPLAENV